MNKRIKKNRFGSTKSQMRADLKNLTISLLDKGHITTTPTRAKATKRYVEILLGNVSDDENSRRKLEGQLNHNKKIVDKIINEYLKEFKKEKSGFINVYKVGFRKGDGSEMIKLMMKNYKPQKKSKLRKVKKKDEKKEEETKSETPKQTKKAKRDLTNDSQKHVDATQGKAKSRSGI